MLRTLALATMLVVILSHGSAFAGPEAKLSDPQIAHIAYTAGQLDIEAAKQALDKSKNKDVQAFAQQMVGDHTAVNVQALDLVKKLKVTPESGKAKQAAPIQ